MDYRLAWFLTPAGRRFARATVFIGGAGGFLTFYLPNTLLIDKYKNVTQLYRNGLPIAISPKVKSLVEEVMNDLGKSAAERKLISVYTAYGFDLFRAGSTMVSTGGVVGVPHNFKYSEQEEFDHTGITLNNQPVAWSSAKGDSLMKSLILSDEAKKFALAREFVHLDSGEPFVFGAVTAGVVGMGYTIASGLNRNQQFYARPRGLRVIMYGLVSLFSYGMWVFGRDMGTNLYEAEADKTVADLGEKYAQGGLEFYEKVLQRNVALRSLMGTTGEKLYTAYGNDQMLLRTKHIPFTLRRDFFKQRLNDYRNSHKTSQPQADTLPESVPETLPMLEGKKVP
ncbi:transmembrane protein 177-like isoform X2 [Penaeus japonicus]|uniref:transmembrane protein 177-like isoform X2 n=1 Tax=Penaeus japonicus TaxID=27405 RepID=UPI001C7119DA|nr:transmembrane protein 177-like isoform X2 [Penaeus japonicus]